MGLVSSCLLCVGGIGRGFVRAGRLLREHVQRGLAEV